MEKREPSSSVGGNANWCSHHGKHSVGVPQDIKIELPYSSAIPPLDMYTKKMKSLS